MKLFALTSAAVGLMTLINCNGEIDQARTRSVHRTAQNSQENQMIGLKMSIISFDALKIKEFLGLNHFTSDSDENSVKGQLLHAIMNNPTVFPDSLAKMAVVDLKFDGISEVEFTGTSSFRYVQTINGIEVYGSFARVEVDTITKEVLTVSLNLAAPLILPIEKPCTAPQCFTTQIQNELEKQTGAKMGILGNDAQYFLYFDRYGDNAWHNVIVMTVDTIETRPINGKIPSGVSYEAFDLMIDIGDLSILSFISQFRT